MMALRRFENSPLTIAEAFAARTPVIGSDTCGVEEHIKNGINGLVFRRGDANDLLEKLNRFIACPKLLSNIRSGITPPRTMQSYIQGFIETYTDLMKID